MRIKTKEDADQVRSLIGEQNYAGVRLALADGASVWVFQSEDEINADPDLSPEEKAACLKILRDEKLGYAGWLRRPERHPTADEIAMGLAANWRDSNGGYYDPHGNYHGGGGSNQGGTH